MPYLEKYDILSVLYDEFVSRGRLFADRAFQFVVLFVDIEFQLPAVL